MKPGNPSHGTVDYSVGSDASEPPLANCLCASARYRSISDLIALEAQVRHRAPLAPAPTARGSRGLGAGVTRGRSVIASGIFFLEINGPFHLDYTEPRRGSIHGWFSRIFAYPSQGISPSLRSFH